MAHRHSLLLWYLKYQNLFIFDTAYISSSPIFTTCYCSLSFCFIWYICYPFWLIYDLQNKLSKSQSHLSTKKHRSTTKKEKMLHITNLFSCDPIQAVTFYLVVDLQAKKGTYLIIILIELKWAQHISNQSIFYLWFFVITSLEQCCLILSWWKIPGKINHLKYSYKFRIKKKLSKVLVTILTIKFVHVNSPEKLGARLSHMWY